MKNYQRFKIAIAVVPVLLIAFFVSGLIFNRDAIAPLEVLPSALWFALMLYLMGRVLWDARKD
jgi:hypothetical protein